MLVLSRYVDESVIIIAGGKEIRVTLVLIKDGKIRIGFEADQDVVILREELIDKTPVSKGRLLELVKARKNKSNE